MLPPGFLLTAIFFIVLPAVPLIQAHEGHSHEDHEGYSRQDHDYDRHPSQTPAPNIDQPSDLADSDSPADHVSDACCCGGTSCSDLLPDTDSVLPPVPIFGFDPAPDVHLVSLADELTLSIHREMQGTRHFRELLTDADTVALAAGHLADSTDSAGATGQRIRGIRVMMSALQRMMCELQCCRETRRSMSAAEIPAQTLSAETQLRAGPSGETPACFDQGPVGMNIPGTGRPAVTETTDREI